MSDPKKPKFALHQGTVSDHEPPEAGHAPPPAPLVPPAAHPAAKAGIGITERTIRRAPDVESPPVAAVPRAPVPTMAIEAIPDLEVIIERPFVPPTEDEKSWVLAKRLGSASGVVETQEFGRIRVASHIAAMVLSSSPDDTTGKTQVYVRVRFFPDPGKDWERKLLSQNRKRFTELEDAIAIALAQLPKPIESGLVVRFVGGPPMPEDDARIAGYQVWTSAERAPVRCEYAFDYVDERRKELKAFYENVGGGLARWWLTTVWWPLVSSEKLASYNAGEVEARSTTETTRASPTRQMLEHAQFREPLERLAAQAAAPVVQSLVSIVWFVRPDLKRLLAEKGVDVGDDRATRLGTYHDGPSELYDENGGGPKVRR